MEFGAALLAVILFALIVATAGGFLAAAFLVHAAEERSRRGDGPDSR